VTQPNPSVTTTPFVVSVEDESIIVDVSSGIGPQGPAGSGESGGVTLLNGLSGSVVLDVTGGTVDVSGQTITLTVTSGAASWSTISGKPSTFPPSTHTHTASDITDFASAVNNTTLSGGGGTVTGVVGSLAGDIDRLHDVEVSAWQPNHIYLNVPTSTHPWTLVEYGGIVYQLHDAHTSGETFDSTERAYWKQHTASAPPSHSHVISDTTGLQAALDSKSPLASPTFTGTVSGVTKSMVGLGSVDNTADSAKPVSTAQAAADSAVQSYAVQRANHTGTQAWSTIVSTPTTLSGYGITDAVSSSDSRLSDARTPVSHVHGNITNAGAIGVTTGQIVVTTTSGVLTTAATISAATQVSGLAAVATSGSASDLGAGTLPFARIPTGSTSTTVCIGNDSRLSDARTPTAHNQAWSTITSTPTTLVGYGITDAATSTHVHGNITNAGAIGVTTGQIVVTTTSGVLTTAAIGSGLSLSAGTLTASGGGGVTDGNKGDITVTGGTWTINAGSVIAADIASSAFASTSAADQVSASLITSPARFQDFSLAWWSVIPGTGSSVSGGAFTAYSHLIFIDSGSTANGTSIGYLNAAGAATSLFGRGSSSIDFSKRRAFAFRISRDQGAAANGIFRAVLGPYVSSVVAGGTALASRGISVELRGTSSAIWLVVHDGTTRTEVDSTQTYSAPCDLLVDSDGAGNVKLFRDGTQIASTSGGPTAATPAAGSVRYEVTNGGSAARYAFFVSFIRVLVGN
jgi:hypothetical protein